MKFLLVILMLSPLAHAERATTHGMLVVGKEQVFLSHLPMFHAPHDRQVILSVELDAAGKGALQKSQTESTETVYTFVPDPFVLSDFLLRLHPLKGDLYRGHFEREGELIAKGITAGKVQIVYAQKLDHAAPVPEHAAYFAFGSASGHFLAHVIGGAPNFDQIVELEAGPFSGGLYSCQELHGSQALGEGQSCTSLHAFPAKVKKQIYLETGDLEG